MAWSSSRRGSGKKTEDICSECQKVVGEKDKGLECELCKEWFHSRCQGISDEAYRVIGIQETVHWFCLQCNKEAIKIIQMLGKVQGRVDELEGKFKVLGEQFGGMDKLVKEVCEKIKVVEGKVDSTDLKMHSEINKIEERVKGGEAAGNEINEGIEVRLQAKLRQDLDTRVESLINGEVKKMNENLDEKMEIERRKSNIIIHGIKEEGIVRLDDIARELDEGIVSREQSLVEEILKEGLKLDATRHIEEVKRIGRFKEGVVRPMRVVLKSPEARTEILRRAKNLKEHDEYKKVYIAPDLTRNQREEDKKLREELKKLKEQGQTNIKIRRGKIVKNMDGGQEQVLFQIGQM